jgi:DNA-binding protein WhiA
LVFLGAGYAALEMQNNLAVRELRNNVNRQNNCFESNLDKTIKTSNLQLTAINFIIENYSIDYLHDSLKEVALARLANPDISLNDLKTILNNKLSRAGIKYRLDKIIDLYNKLKGD